MGKGFYNGFEYDILEFFSKNEKLTHTMKFSSVIFSDINKFYRNSCTVLYVPRSPASPASDPLVLQRFILGAL